MRDQMKREWVIASCHDSDPPDSKAMETRQCSVVMPGFVRHARDISELGGLQHDLGKLNKRFQSKIRPDFKPDPVAKGEGAGKGQGQRDDIRHEWLSAHLVDGVLTGNIDSAGSLAEALKGLGQRRRVYSLPVEQVVSWQDAVKFCVVSHHRLFAGGSGSSARTEHEIENHCKNGLVPRDYFRAYFPPPSRKGRGKQKGKVQTPEPKEAEAAEEAEAVKVLNAEMQAHASGYFVKVKRTTERLQAVEASPEYWQGVSWVARAALILADHAVSSEIKEHAGVCFYANSAKKADMRILNQSLAWHLNAVSERARQYCALFAVPDMPCLGPVSDVLGRVLESSTSPRFKWQDEAVAFFADEARQGRQALVFNVASTGSGKTRANVKILAALRKGQPLRITSAFNLRTLTLQTRDAYRDELGLNESELACVVGDEVSVRLHDANLEPELDVSGSDKEFDEAEHIETEFNAIWTSKWRELIPESMREFIGDDAKLAAILCAPVLVTTADHLIAAGEPGRQAVHAKALIRVMSSDLVIDEADSYDTKALMAVVRVIRVAAMFGRNVVVSSATLPVALANAIMRAWNDGVKIHRSLINNEAAGAGKASSLLSANPEGGSEGVSEDKASCFAVSDLCEPLQVEDGEGYGRYVKSMAGPAGTKITKRFVVLPVGDLVGGSGQAEGESLESRFSGRIFSAAMQFHEHHHTHHETEGAGEHVQRISVGLVRVAHIKTCIPVARALRERAKAEDGREDGRRAVFVTAYHSRELLGRRFLKERALDRLLNRKGVDSWWEGHEHASRAVEEARKAGIQDVVFIVVATPVEEVGRDHDYDWAVIEPSSMTSIIQCSGRVNRHRLVAVDTANIGVLSHSLAHLHFLLKGDQSKKRLVYRQPGHRLDGWDGSHMRGCDLRSAQDMLPADVAGDMSGRGVPIDVSLIFGDTRCDFAAEDEKAIAKTVSNALNALTDGKSWMNDWMYKSFRLREQDERKRSLVYVPEQEQEGIACEWQKGLHQSKESFVCVARVSENAVFDRPFLSWSVAEATAIVGMACSDSQSMKEGVLSFPWTEALQQDGEQCAALVLAQDGVMAKRVETS